MTQANWRKVIRFKVTGEPATDLNTLTSDFEVDSVFLM